MRRRNIFRFTAAFLSTHSNSLLTEGFILGSPSLQRPSLEKYQHNHRQQIGFTTRNYATNNNDDDSYLSKVKGAAKSILPQKWFQTEEEKKAEIQRVKVQNEVTGGLAEILKDAPLPIRMLGKMVGPIMSKLASGLAETMAEQQASVQNVMNDAKSCLYGDETVRQTLGEPISVADTPFSQSSSSSNMNGQTTSRTELSFQVSGSRNSGIARAIASQDGIQALTLDVDGRVINIDVTKRGSVSARMAGSGKYDGDDIIEAEIVEAEIIEKNTK